MAIDGRNSNAALAHLLGAPVVLVIDTQGMTRGIAPLILGYQQFDKQIQIAGVILNRVGGDRHESKLRESMAYYTDVPVIGAVRRDASLVIEERHLGLMPSNEDNLALDKIKMIAKRIAEQVNLDQLINIAAKPTWGDDLVNNSKLTWHESRKVTDIKIGVMRDAALRAIWKP